MKLFRFFYLLLPVILSSCSHNNGGDPALYGTWQLAEIQADGVAVPDYGNNWFWKFQTDIVLIQEVDDGMHEYTDHFGTWSFSDDHTSLVLNFSHSDDDNPASTGQYAPPDGIFITEPITPFEVLALSGNRMTLEQISLSGNRYIYTLFRR